MAADKINLKLGLWIAMTLVFIAFLILASEPGYPLMLVAAGLMGLAAGGMLPVWGALMARVFGLVSYGRAMGLMGPLITLSVLPSFAVVGRLFDATGSYRSSLLDFAGVIAVATLLLCATQIIHDAIGSSITEHSSNMPTEMPALCSQAVADQATSLAVFSPSCVIPQPGRNTPSTAPTAQRYQIRWLPLFTRNGGYESKD